jgi:hypothetical protein
MAKINISTDELLRDMLSGKDDDALMVKYRLSAKLFETLCDRLVETGQLTASKFSELKLLWAQKKGKVWRCPACHMPQHHPFDECPQCGIIISKYEKKLSGEKAGEVAAEKHLLSPQCSACGHKLSSEAKFCSRCGCRVRSGS